MGGFVGLPITVPSELIWPSKALQQAAEPGDSEPLLGIMTKKQLGIAD